jgi:hypothetical protein
MFIDLTVKILLALQRSAMYLSKSKIYVAPLERRTSWIQSSINIRSLRDSAISSRGNEHA